MKYIGPSQNFSIWRLDAKDINYLPTAYEKHSHIMMRFSSSESLDLDYLSAYPDTTIAVSSLEQLTQLKDANPPNKYLWAFPVSTYQELRALISFGVSYIILANSPLFFNIPNIKKEFPSLKICAVADKASPFKNIPSPNGAYIRPEDISIYEPYIDYIEFSSNKKAETLLHIYQDLKEWKGNLNLLLTNLSFDMDNRNIPQDFATLRLQCEQKCMKNPKSCSYCINIFKISQALDNYQDPYIQYLRKKANFSQETVTEKETEN